MIGLGSDKNITWHNLKENWILILFPICPAIQLSTSLPPCLPALPPQRPSDSFVELEPITCDSKWHLSPHPLVTLLREAFLSPWGTGASSAPGDSKWHLRAPHPLSHIWKKLKRLAKLFCLLEVLSSHFDTECWQHWTNIIVLEELPEDMKYVLHISRRIFKIQTLRISRLKRGVPPEEELINRMISCAMQIDICLPLDKK